MPGISDVSRARGLGIGWKPSAVKACTLGLMAGVGDAANMPKLEHHRGAADVDGLCHAFPAFDLLLAVNAGRRDVALAIWRDLGRLCDDKAGTRALGVIERTELGRYVAGTGAAAS